MNGPIAQLVALTCHANGCLQHASDAQFFPDNSTCKFCDRIVFVEIKKSWLGKPSVRTVADDPDRWFKHLVERGVTGVRIVYQQKGDPRISDRMSAGFVGGGGQWMLAVQDTRATEYWVARWEVWNQHAPAQRIWRVTYGLVARDQGSPPAGPSFPDDSFS